jgi:hypothetical protein
VVAQLMALADYVRQNGLLLSKQNNDPNVYFKTLPNIHPISFFCGCLGFRLADFSNYLIHRDNGCHQRNHCEYFYSTPTLSFSLKKLYLIFFGRILYEFDKISLVQTEVVPDKFIGLTWGNTFQFERDITESIHSFVDETIINLQPLPDIFKHTYHLPLSGPLCYSLVSDLSLNLLLIDRLQSTYHKFVLRTKIFLPDSHSWRLAKDSKLIIIEYLYRENYIDIFRYDLKTQISFSQKIAFSNDSFAPFSYDPMFTFIDDDLFKVSHKYHSPKVFWFLIDESKFCQCKSPFSKHTKHSKPTLDHS